jgi:hypothetical protein
MCHASWVMCDVSCVMCQEAWGVMLWCCDGVMCVMCDVCDVMWCVMWCDVRCVMRDVWCVMFHQWRSGNWTWTVWVEDWRLVHKTTCDVWFPLWCGACGVWCCATCAMCDVPSMGEWELNLDHLSWRLAPCPLDHGHAVPNGRKCGEKLIGV